MNRVQYIRIKVCEYKAATCWRYKGKYLRFLPLYVCTKLILCKLDPISNCAILADIFLVFHILLLSLLLIGSWNKSQSMRSSGNIPHIALITCSSNYNRRQNVLPVYCLSMQVWFATRKSELCICCNKLRIQLT